MPINKVAGVMLEDNLLRNGINLTIENNLLVVDVVNQRIGINNSVPASTLDINGSLEVNNIILDNNSITNLDNTGFAFHLSQQPFDVDFSNIINLQDPINNTDASNKRYVDNKVGADYKDRIINADSELRITDTGLGVILDLTYNNGVDTAFRVSELSTDLYSNTSITGTLHVTDTSQITDIQLSTGKISTRPASNIDLEVTSDSSNVTLTGFIRHSATTSNKIVYTDNTNSITSNPSLTFDGTFLTLNGQMQVDNIILNNDTVSSTANMNIQAPNLNITATSGQLDLSSALDNNIRINTSGTGIISMQSATTSLTIPTGSTSERPVIPEIGAIRFNINLGHPEVFDGANWTQFSNQFVDIAFQEIIPDGVSQSYALDRVATTESVIVSLNGVIQSPGSSYNVSAQIITFVDIPQTTDIISIRFISGITTVTAITDWAGDTLVEAFNGEVYVDTAGIRRMSFLGDFTEITSNLIPSIDIGYDLGAPNRQFLNVYSKSTTTNLIGDNIYPVGTVIVAGGPNEVTASSIYADPKVVGVISYDDASTKANIATTGKVICQVDGAVSKGDLLTTSNIAGTATVLNPIDYVPGCVIGKALQDISAPGGNINIILTIL